MYKLYTIFIPYYYNFIVVAMTKLGMRDKHKCSQLTKSYFVFIFESIAVLFFCLNFFL